MAQPATYKAHAFGLRWHSDRPIPWFADATDDGRAADVVVEQTDTLPPRPGGRPVNNGALFADGTRFHFEGAVIDMFDGTRIRWCAPGRRNVPVALCSTVAAHIVAWRGMVPLHGSAIAFDGAAILVAGQSGAGKSTLAQALIACGGQLVSDDLSVLLPVAAGDVPLLVPGRPAIRLSDPDDDGTGAPKRLSLPPRVDPDCPVPLALLLLLQREPPGTSAAGPVADLRAQLFRPTWMRVLPNGRSRLETLLHTAAAIRVATLPPAGDVPGQSPAERAAAALALLRGPGGLYSAAPAL